MTANFSEALIILLIVLLLESGFLSAMEASLIRLGRIQGEERLKKSRLFRVLLGKFTWDGAFFFLRLAKPLVQISFIITAIFAFPATSWSWLLPSFILLILLFDYGFAIASGLHPRMILSLFAPLASIVLIICLPLGYPLYHLARALTPKPKKDKSIRLRDKILDFLTETDLRDYLDSNDQKLLLSVATFKERIVREVMVPRIDVFSLPSDTTLQDAAGKFLSERYSRIPVYRDSVDNIIGVLLYKDVLSVYARSSEKHLDMIIEKLVKPVLYTPETKKISQLLQEFRSKQIHLAIVVDEYGGTEGIITIEDILEELVGEIADEYDVGEEMLFTPLPGGGWIVDAKMGILDIEEELNIKIPTSPEYDTIGGYVFHRAGAIPQKGWKMHHDEFDLEVLSSDDRSIDKIRITPH